MPLALIILFALLLRIGGAWDKELWLDELHSAMIASRPVAEWILPGDLGGYTPLYFLISVPFSRWGTDFATRIPSIFFGTALVVMGYHFARQYGSRRFALTTALLLACSPVLIVFSSYHRMYALYPLLVLCMYYFSGSDSKNATRNYALASAAAFLTFPIAAFYAAAFALMRPRKKEVLGAVIVAVLGIAWCLPGVFAIIKDAGVGEPTAPDLNPLTSYLFLRFPKFLLGGPFGHLDSTLRLFAMPLILVGWAALGRGMFSSDSVSRRLAIATLLPPILEGAAGFFGFSTYLDKSYIPSAVFLLILMARILERIPLGSVLLIFAFFFIDSRWIDPAHPFSMKERRDEVQVPLQEVARHRIEGIDTGDTLLPLILSEQTALFGAFRYAPVSPRVRYAPAEMEVRMVIRGPYRDLTRAVMADAGIQFVPEANLPKEALWLGRARTRAGQEILTTSAGFALLRLTPQPQSSAPARLTDEIAEGGFRGR